MSASRLDFENERKKKKIAVGIIIVLISIIIISATSATIISKEGNKTDTSEIWLETLDNGNGSSPYRSLSADYSGLAENKTAKVLEPIVSSQGVGDVSYGGLAQGEMPWIGNLNNTIESDGDYLSLITRKIEEGLFDERNSEKILGYEGMTENATISRAGYLDNKGIKTISVVEPFKTGEVSQTYRLRGGSYFWFDLFKGISAFESEGLETLEDFTEVFNHHSAGAYPSYLEELNFTVRLKFTDLSNPTAAYPLEYRVELYNYLLEKWDAIRVENTTFVTTYAQGIYQDDQILLNRGNINFEPYFDPDDRMTMKLRVKQRFAYRSSTKGTLQEIDVDLIKYRGSWSGYASAFLLDPDDLPDDLYRDNWRYTPELLLECKSNATTAHPDEVMRSTFFQLLGMSNQPKIPTGPFDKGIYPNVNTRFYNKNEGFPVFYIIIQTLKPVKIDIDWIQHTFYPEFDEEIENRWYANETGFVGEYGQIDSITWGMDVTTSPQRFDINIDFAEEFVIKSVITPTGDDATEVFEFSNEFNLGKKVTNTFGHGRYQIILESPNYIIQSSITDGSYDPINETTYTSPVRHRTEILNFEELTNEGNLGSVEVTFITKKGDVIYSNVTSIEVPDVVRGFFRGQSTFTGSAVGVVDCVYTWTNGENFGIYISQFVMLGSSDAEPFIKIFNPNEGDRVNDDEVLYVAIISNQPDQEGFALDGSLDYEPLSKGYQDSFRGVSKLLSKYTYYAQLPVEDLSHNTNHFITVKAQDALNGKSSEEEVLMTVDKLASISISSISEAYDDTPTKVNVSVEADVVLMNIYLDDQLVARFTGDSLRNQITIPKLQSGTYFLDIKVWDDLGNYGVDTATFFVNQRNPTVVGTLIQWISDFFKILGIMIASIFGGMGIVIYGRKKWKGRSGLCPDGMVMKNGVCEVLDDE